MPTATRGNTTAKPDFTAAMTRLREIALTSADNALTEGPVNADRKLLDLCAEALYRLKHAEAAIKQRQDMPFPSRHEPGGAEAWAELERLSEEHRGGIKSAKPLLHWIRKEKATTAAGIYAKAAVVRASKTGAADLAMSLAEDLLDNLALRAALWPAEEAR